MAKQGKTTAVSRLRFPDFTGQPLREVRLSDVTTESALRNGDELPATSVRGVSKLDGIVPMEERTIAADIARYKVVRKDWFAYNPMRLNIGSIARWRGDADVLVSPDYVVFRCLDDSDSGIDPDYLDHFRRSMSWGAFVSEGGDGGVRIRIYYKDLARLRLALPSRAEQRKIADCLTSLDDVIAAQGRRVETLKAYTRGLMQELFPREGETLPRRRFGEFRDAPEWNTKRLGTVCEMQAGKFVAASDIAEVQEAGTYPCFGGNGLRGFTKTYTHLGRHSLIGRQGALCGNVSLVGGAFHATEHALVTTPKAGVSVDWLFYALRFLNLNRFATGQAQPGLSVEVLGKVELAVPRSEREQQIVAASLATADDRLALESAKLDALKAHKKGLIQRLFPSSKQR